MRTNILLNDDLINEAMRLTGAGTKRETVDIALREFISRHRQREVLDLAGQNLIDSDYDIRKMRAGMTNDSG